MLIKYQSNIATMTITAVMADMDIAGIVDTVVVAMDTADTVDMDTADTVAVGMVIAVTVDTVAEGMDTVVIAPLDTVEVDTDIAEEVKRMMNRVRNKFINRNNTIFYL